MPHMNDEVPIPIPLLLHPQVKVVDLRVFGYAHGNELYGEGIITRIEDLMLATGHDAKAARASVLRLRGWGVVHAEPLDDDPEQFTLQVADRPWEPFEYSWKARLMETYQRRFPGPQELEEAIEQQVHEQLLTYWCLRNNIRVSPTTGEYRQEGKEGVAGLPILAPNHERLAKLYPEIEPTFRRMAREYVTDLAGVYPEPKELTW